MPAQLSGDAGFGAKIVAPADRAVGQTSPMRFPKASPSKPGPNTLDSRVAVAVEPRLALEEESARYKKALERETMEKEDMKAQLLKRERQLEEVRATCDVYKKKCEESADNSGIAAESAKPSKVMRLKTVLFSWTSLSCCVSRSKY